MTTKSRAGKLTLGYPVLVAEDASGHVCSHGVRAQRGMPEICPVRTVVHKPG
jgi:hypothetical protein